MAADDPVDEVLNRWKSEFESDSNLASRVRAQVRESGGYGTTRPATVAVWIGNAFSRPGLAASFAAVFVLVGIGLSQLLMQGFASRGEEATLSYRLSIDPLYRLEAMAGADEFKDGSLALPRSDSERPAVLLAGLGWLQGELGLSRAQLSAVTQLHSEYETAFNDLFAQLLQSHRAYRVFDRKRMDDDVIDYFEFYDLLQNQKKLSEQSTRLTEELLRKVEQVITPSQRVRYRELLDSIYPQFSKDSIETTDV